MQILMVKTNCFMFKNIGCRCKKRTVATDCATVLCPVTWVNILLYIICYCRTSQVLSKCKYQQSCGRCRPYSRM